MCNFPPKQDEKRGKKTKRGDEDPTLPAAKRARLGDDGAPTIRADFPPGLPEDLSTLGRLLTPAEFDQRLRALGAARPPSAADVLRLPDVKGHKKVFLTALGDPRTMDKDAFGEKYRRMMPRQDELVSTSAVRELLSGALDRAVDPEAWRKAEIIFDNLSKVSRMPTHIVGVATADWVMQHPSNKAQALFGDWSQTTSLHTHLDRVRKQVGLVAGEAEARRPGSTLESILNAMLRETIIFTVNWMAGPIAADDVWPYARRGPSLTPEERAGWSQAREAMKNMAVELGARRTPGPPQSMEALFNLPGKNKRQASPEREFRPKRSGPSSSSGPPNRSDPTGPLSSSPFDPARARTPSLHQLDSLPASPRAGDPMQVDRLSDAEAESSAAMESTEAMEAEAGGCAEGLVDLFFL
jgi:hypothetical protein